MSSFLKKDSKSHIFKHLHSTATCFDLYNSLCFKIIDRADSKFGLKIKEALYINWRKSSLKTAEVSNNFFFSIVQNLDSSRYSSNEPLVSKTNDPTLKAILKYKNHPSNIAIQNKCKDEGNLNFIKVDQKQIKKEILNLDVRKAPQSSDVLIKVLKKTAIFLVIFSVIVLTIP